MIGIPPVLATADRMSISIAYAVEADLAFNAAQAGVMNGGGALLDLLRAAAPALRSYQHGNEAPTLARKIADACEAVWLTADPPEPGTQRHDLLMALKAAWHALRSYQYGNASPDLANSIASACDAAIARAEGCA